MRSETKTLIACKVMADEIKAVLQPYPHVRVVWLEAALHTDFHQLETKLSNALSGVAREPGQVGVLYGRGCLPGIELLLRKFNAVQMSEMNCIEALLGPYIQEFDNAFLLTPGWVRAWPSIMKSMNWDACDVRMQLGRYKRIVIFEPAIRPLSEQEILQFFDLTGVFVELEHIDLHYFRKQLQKLLHLQHRD